ncbi:MAG: DNA-formamidopyrimidine glycosylase family protein [Baekduia sp.]
MPEGDTIHYAANRIRPVLEGQVPDAIATPHARFGKDRWPQRLQGREVESVTAHGKHLFLRFAGDLTIHSHLRMTGAWRVHPEGTRWHRAPRRAWLVITYDGQDVVQFDGPVLELLTETRRRFDLRLGALGPDIVAEDFDPGAVLRRLREDDPTRGIGDALLDQRTIAGIGNLWKAEGCWLAEVDPWRPTATVGDDEVLRIVEELRPRMRESARDGNQKRHRKIYGNAGRACPRCGERIAARGQGDDNRTTYWCPGCQS